MRKAIRGLFLLFVSFSIASSAQAQATISGYVQTENGTPLKNTTVNLKVDYAVTPGDETWKERAPSERTVQTDAQGYFEFSDVKSERYRLEAEYVQKIGRHSLSFTLPTESFTVRGKEAQRFTFAFAPLPEDNQVYSYLRNRAPAKVDLRELSDGIAGWHDGHSMVLNGEGSAVDLDGGYLALQQ